MALSQQNRIDKAANDYNRTKDKKYKNLWYKLIREYVNGSYHFERRVIPINSSVKTDDGRYQVIRQPKLLRLVRRAKVKAIGLRR